MSANLVVKESEAADVPTVSVCVPVYNYGRFIADCIESVLAQTFTEWELIICDDQSTDETWKICQEYTRKDNRIRCFRNATRLGMFQNFRRTITYASGMYFKPLCADDWLHPEYLEGCLALMKKYPTAGLVATNCIDTDIDGTPLASNYFLPREFFLGTKMIWREIVGLGGIGGNSSFLIRRWAYEAVSGYDTRFRYAADHHLGLKLCLLGDFAYTNRPLFYGRHHEQQSSAVNPARFWDVPDYLHMAGDLFPTRSRFDKNWWITRVIVGRIGSNYVVTALNKMVHKDYGWGKNLLGVTFRQAPLHWPIILMLPITLLSRVWFKLLSKTARCWRRRAVLPVVKPVRRKSDQAAC